MDTTKAVTHVSLCAGYGGIDLGLKRAIPDLRTIAVAEIEAFACANLVAKMEAGRLDPAPIWSDLKTFPWSSFRGKVGILSGGYPCQPFSAAGKRLGADDPRHLWPFIAAGIAAMRPGLCFFENVEGHISLGLEQVLRDLQGLGYRCTFGIFSASEVGATHQRKRIFIMAHDAYGQQREGGLLQQNGEGPAIFIGCSSAGKLAHGESTRLERQRQFKQSELRNDPWPSRPGQQQFPWEPPRVLAYGNGGEPSEGRGNAGEVCSISEAQRQSEHGSALPRGKGQDRGGETVADAQHEGSGEGGELCAGPDGQQPVSDGEARGTDGLGHAGVQESRWLPSGSGRGEVLEAGESGRAVGNAECAERRPDDNWITGEADKGSSHASSSDRRQTESALGGNADGSAGRLDYAQLCISGDSRVDELRLLGNGVVPATAERAFNVLASRLFT